MKQYLLDTNAIAHFLHDKFSMPEKINSVGIDNCYVSEITIAELYYGSYNSTFIEENLQQAEEVKATFIILPISKVLKQYGLQRAKAKKRKLSNVSSEDLFIGATAIHYDMVLVTQNTKDFIEVDELNQEDWTKPEYNEFI